MFSRSVVSDSAAPMDCSTSGLLVPDYLLEFAQVHVQCFGDAIQPFHPLTPILLLPSIFPNIRDFSNESSVCIRWSKYWSFSFRIDPSSEYSELISLKIDWFDLAVEGTLKSLLQYHNSKASVLLCSAFLMVQLLHLYTITWKTIVIAYGEQCLICDLWRRRFSFGTRDQAWSFKSFCVAEFY